MYESHARQPAVEGLQYPCSHGSFTLAAKELYLSQSAVSHSMKALEQDVGCRLLDRMGKKVMLTQAGEQLLQAAEKILREMSSARASLEQLGKWGRSRCGSAPAPRVSLYSSDRPAGI